MGHLQLYKNKIKNTVAPIQILSTIRDFQHKTQPLQKAFGELALIGSYTVDVSLNLHGFKLYDVH